MYPDIEDRSATVSLSKAKKAISDYSKATKDLKGVLDLRVTYIESGHRFTHDFGDMYDQFYQSLISMFERVVQDLIKDPDMISVYYGRLEKIALESGCVGWGYSDIKDIFQNFSSKVKAMGS